MENQGCHDANFVITGGIGGSSNDEEVGIMTTLKTMFSV